ncbi:MAG: hypothetical protein R3D29_14360 [Nitratireductor sp.]
MSVTGGAAASGYRDAADAIAMLNTMLARARAHCHWPKCKN